MKLIWARYALDDRETIFSYIERENPRAAVHVDEEIVRATRRLLEYPESGRPGRWLELGSLLYRAHHTSQPMSRQPIGYGSCVFFMARRCRLPSSRATSHNYIMGLLVRSPSRRGVSLSASCLYSGRFTPEHIDCRSAFEDRKIMIAACIDEFISAQKGRSQSTARPSSRSSKSGAEVRRTPKTTSGHKRRAGAKPEWRALRRPSSRAEG
jgi:plasmid stabilization system protein ParE